MEVNDTVCSVCSQKSLFYSRTADGKLCHSCSKRFPTGIKRSFRQHRTSNLIQLLGYSDLQDKSRFNPTSSIGSLALDETHGLLALTSKPIKDRIPADTILISVLDLEEIGIDSYKPHVTTRGVRMSVEFTCRIHGLPIPIRQIIKSGIACHSTRVDSEHIRWEEPATIGLFRSMVLTSAELQQQGWLNRMAAFQKIRHSEEERRAMDMLLLDDGYTQEELKEQKNRLVKAFHPDVEQVDDKYIKKVLDAYKILKGHNHEY